MRVVVALDERLAESPLGQVPRILAVRDADVLLVHVLDTGVREEWEQGAMHRLLRSRASGADRAGMQEVDRGAGERLLAAAAAQTGDWAAGQVRTRLLEGSPKHVIRDLLDREGADVLVVFVHGHEVGPRSIHKEARFLIDHAPCPVLVVKG